MTSAKFDLKKRRKALRVKEKAPSDGVLVESDLSQSHEAQSSAPARHETTPDTSVTPRETGPSGGEDTMRGRTITEKWTTASLAPARNRPTETTYGTRCQQTTTFVPRRIASYEIIDSRDLSEGETEGECNSTGAGDPSQDEMLTGLGYHVVGTSFHAS